MNAEIEAYQNLSIDYFYLGAMEKASFYDNKFKYGMFEGADSVVRKVAVGIIKNRLENHKKGRANEKWINGKLVKTNFDRMPSPSSFGGGIAMKTQLGLSSMEAEAEAARRLPTDNLIKSDYDRIERSKKPFADFKMPDLQHLNTPKVKDYLKRPRRVKFDKKPIEIA